MSTKPPPVSELIAGLAARVGVPAFAAVCVDLLALRLDLRVDR